MSGWSARWAVLASVLGAGLTAGQPAPGPEKEAPRFTWQDGPRTVALGHALTLQLPEGYAFLPKEQAVKAMAEMGNLHNEGLLGLVTQADADWLVTISYVDEGHVKDDEAARLDADAILDDIKEGTEQANEERTAKGFKAIEVVGWSDPPRYEPATHQLVWGVEATEAGERFVNFRTRVLGRTGFASLNLIDSAAGVAAHKPSAEVLLAATSFDPGARYEDFDASKDKVAEYGLGMLVAGGAGAAALKAAKVGLLAKFGAKLLALLVAGKKLVVVAAVGLLAFLRKLFGKKDAATSDLPPAGPPPGAPPPPVS